MSLGKLSVASAVIELQNVTVDFQGEVILKNINLKVNRGEKVALIGPSGQGKSVLLKLMAGLITPSRGQVLIEGENLAQMSDARRQQIVTRLGMLFQKNALFDSLNVSENVAFPLREVTSLGEQEIAQKVGYFLEAVGLSHVKDLFPSEISGGMQKRLGIARALALEPQIVFYDDPTAGLDPITSRKIVELIIELQKKLGSTFVAITNDMNRAYQMADRILMVVDCELIDTGSPEQTLQNLDPRVYQFIRGDLKGPLTVSNLENELRPE